MSGGKETPRQKMIGMMYLVLTALLALNVSKSILDAFVAIEENTQKSNIAHHDRGQGFKDALKEELTSTKPDAENAAKIEKIKFWQKKMNDIDAETAKLIESIDNIKLDIMKKSGEDVSYSPSNNGVEEKIIWSAYDKKNLPLLPIRMNLMAVQAKDQYDIPMHEIVGDEIKAPKGVGLKLWDDFNAYRGKLVEMVGSYKIGGKTFTIKPKAVNEYKDNKDLSKIVEKMVKTSNCNHQEDEEILKQLYIELTKPLLNRMGEEEGVHWIGKTFDHSPLVAAVASLSSMQQDILAARASALAHIKGKISTGEYSFNKVTALAYGPAISNANEEVEIKVMMAAFDSDNQPIVTYNGAKVSEVQDGYGLVKTKTSGGAEMVLKGTVSIKKKSGDMKTENWEHTIKIMKPEGTVSLPEMLVLYRGYKNIIEGVASGYPETKLSGTNVTLSKVGKQYVGTPGAGKTANISISGFNPVSKKTVSLGTYVFDVKPMPRAELFWGNAADGDRVTNKAAKKLRVAFGDGIPLKATFQCEKWFLTISGINKTFQGQGEALTDEALKFLGAAKPGSLASFSSTYRGPGVAGKPNSATFKL